MDGRGLQGARSARVVIRPDDLQGAARLLTRVSDPRAAVCLAASWMLRADVAELWEPRNRGLARALERDLAASRRTNRNLAVAVLDLDHFKAFNDTHGHPTGDLLLRNAVRAWREHLRAGDMLARYGGEEFVVVLPDAGDAVAAVRAIERVRVATPGVSASAGVA